MSGYDIYLRHASVRSGEWVGFRLAWKDLGYVSGFSAWPHTRLRSWVLDPAQPDDPAQGSWGVRQWHFDVALLDRLTGLQGEPLAGGYGAGEMRDNLLAYIDLPALELKDTDAAIYTTRMTGYTEHCIEPYDLAHPSGGWFAKVEFTETAAAAEARAEPRAEAGP